MSRSFLTGALQLLPGVGVTLLLTACATPYKPTLKMEATFDTIPAKVLVRPLVDASPPDDKQNSSEASLSQTAPGSMEGDLSVLVTKAIVADFSATGVFQTLHRNQQSPDLILSGTIHQFYGEVSTPSWLHVPWMSWAAHAYWVPFQQWAGEVDLELVLSTADGRMLGTYRGQADYSQIEGRDHHYWSMPLYPAHARLNRAFTEAVEQIRDQIFGDRDKLLAVLHR
ncbi:MAG: hypothetical protein EPO61_04620 [Nitrospirae bacterium]|nr:MAG: hypothetical protein EPO61_04620 [Nitrospirota bacterium]